MIVVKDPELKRKVFKSIDKYDNLAIKAYKSGKIKIGLKYEKKSDNLYKNKYNKIFKIVT